MNELILYIDRDADPEKVKKLAGRLNIRVVSESGTMDSEKETSDTETADRSVLSKPERDEKGDLYLRLDQEGLSLNQGGMKMRGDFQQMLPRLKPGKLGGEMLVKAAKLKGLTERPVAIDATAGMGEDSILLAAAGYEVHLFEKDPIIAALLEDALERASALPELVELTSRMILHTGDSITAMLSREIPADLIYLDPMFPARSKSGLIKKKFQLLQQLERPCSDEKELVQAALQAHPRRIVIKRPAKGPYLAGIKPSYTIDGKAIRYDCLVR